MTAFLPITLGMDVTIVCSNNLEMLKATEAIISMLYKTQSFSVDLGMIRVQAAMEVPEDLAQERLFEYALNDKKEFKVTFSLEVQSFIPVFEGGKVTLADVDLMVKDSLRTVTDGSTEDNPNRDGIGVYRDGAIYFGNVIEKIISTIDDIRKTPISSDGAFYSNEGYVNPDTIQTGPTFSIDEIERDSHEPESEESGGFRNADREDDPEIEDDLADK
jgi:hypothetical protein